MRLLTPRGYSVTRASLGVIFGFLNQVLTLAEKFHCKEFVFCWDSRHSYRKRIYPQYKQNRREGLTPKEVEQLKAIHKQFDELRKQVLPRLGFRNVFCQTGYEADDLIAYIVRHYPIHFPDGGGYLVVSSDNDLWQLLRDRREGVGDSYDVHIYSARSGKVLTREQFEHEWGIKPSAWSLVKAIAGCAGDNVEGIKGVGELTAARYVSGVLRGKKRDVIQRQYDEIVQRNVPLVDLPFRGPRPVFVPELRFEPMWTLDFMDVFGELGFGSFLKEENFERWIKAFDLQKGRDFAKFLDEERVVKGWLKEGRKNRDARVDCGYRF